MRWRSGRAATAAGLMLATAVLVGLASASSAGAAGVPVVVGGARPSMPSISGSQVVWADKYDGNWDLFRYDGITGTTSRLTADAADQSMPSVSGSRVAYVDYASGNGDIVVRDLVTGIATVFPVAGDQTNPTLSGDWLAWEDHASRSTRVRVRNLVTGVTYAAGADGAAAERPRISGDLLVWEDHRASVGGRLDSDVWAMTLSTNTSTMIAGADVTEYYPDTNGRYIVWSERASDGYHIRGYDVTTGRYLQISTGAGEQTTPAITDGKVYWTDNTPGQPLHVDTYDLATGATALFYSYSAGDVVGLSASGGNTAWLETAGMRMRVRVLLGDGLSPLARLATFNPVSSLVSSVRLALIATGGDGTAPAVASVSVDPGELRVPRTSTFAVTFSEPLDPSTVSSRTVRLRDAATGDTVPATVRYAALTNAATLDPVETLASGSFTLEVDPMLTDAAGNALTDPAEITFSTSNATVDVAKPSKPGLTEVVVSGTGSIRATWGASVDDVGIKAYDIYRQSTPMSAADYATWGTPVTSVASNTLTVTFPKAADETAKSYTYYYVVVARDTIDQTSAPSTNMAPNPHGTYSSTVSTNSCMRCHSVHGGALSSPLLGARSAAACYECHGGTPATSAYGVATTMDTQGKFNDDAAIAPGGTGMTGGTGNDGWSIHRTDDLSGSSFGRECDACHSPHRKSYDDVPALSYGRMLRIYSTQGVVGSAPAYSTDAVPLGEKMCYECHGTGSLGVMDSFGGDGTYIATGGDHQSVYETTGAAGAATSPANVKVTTRAARPNGGNLPRIACLACHNQHASPVRALVDYRTSDTTSTMYDQAGLCLTCHSEASAESDSTGTAPFAWNGRDVNAEFQAASHHPLDAGASGPPQPRDGSWMQTTQQQFATDTSFQTTATAGNSVELETVNFTGATTQIFTDGFESNNFNVWTASTNWVTSTTQHRTGGNYSARQNSTTADCTLEKTVDTSGKASATLAFWLYGNGNTASTDYVYVSFKGQDGIWREVWRKTLQDRLAAWTQYSIPIDPALCGGFGTGTAFRIVARVASNTNRYQYLDDVTFTGTTAGTSFYKSPGLVTSTLIVPPIGTLNSWGAVTVNGLEPADTTMTIDVLNGADGLAITGYANLPYNSSPTVIDLTGLSTSLYPTLKVRARLQGNAVDPRIVSDDFNDDTLDAAKWTDYRLNAALDPDNPGVATAFAETWTNVTAVPSSRWPSAYGTWAMNTGWPTATQPSIRGGNGGSTPATLTSVPFNVAGWTGVTITFTWRCRDLPQTTGRMRVQYSYDGTTWSDGWSQAGNGGDSNGTGTFNLATPGSTTYLRLMVENAASGQYGYFDEIAVRGTPPATDIWPDESGQDIVLRASGAGFDSGSASDQGEFLHVKPGTSTSWMDTADWEAVVNVAALQTVSPATLDAGAKAGLMVRAAATDPLVVGAKYAGVFLSGNSTGSWQYRTAAAGNATAVSVAGQVAPKWLKLKRAGNQIGGWFSDDSVNWTSAGTSQTIPATGDKLYVGLAVTSNNNATFVDSVFDDFTVTEILGLSATRSPRLDDWTLTYNYTPSATGTGKVTCSGCHNAHTVKVGSRTAYWDLARVGDPHNTKATPASYNAFCLGCHDSTPPVRTVSGTTLVPYDVVFSTRTEPFFPGWDKTASGAAWSSSGHANSGVTNMSPGCQNCHDPHGSVNQRLVALTAFSTASGQHVKVSRDNTTAYEEGLCLACHGSQRSAPGCTGTGCHPNIDTSGVGMNVQTVLALTYRHPVSTVSGKHSDLEGGVTAFGPSNRHSECVDCHDPHATKKGIHTAGSSAAGPALVGAFGVVPTFSTTQWTVATSFAPQRLTASTDYETYLCLKCHSSYSGQPFSVTTPSGTYISSDQALEFNPANDSGHNVMGTRTSWPKETVGSFKSGPAYSMTWPTNATFVGSWTKTSKLTCTDCHTYSAGNAKGPHGSTVRMLIDSAYPRPYQTAQLGNTDMICAKCHTNLRNANDGHVSDHSGTDGRCIACHIKVPHGWKRPRLLGYTTDPEPYRSLNLTGFTLKSYSNGTWGMGNCGQTGCGEHSALPSGTKWP